MKRLIKDVSGDRWNNDDYRGREYNRKQDVERLKGRVFMFGAEGFARRKAKDWR